MTDDDQMVVEYVGEVIREALSDQREKVYEKINGGDGACYMFKWARMCCLIIYFIYLFIYLFIYWLID